MLQAGLEDSDDPTISCPGFGGLLSSTASLPSLPSGPRPPNYSSKFARSLSRRSSVGGLASQLQEQLEQLEQAAKRSVAAETETALQSGAAHSQMMQAGNASSHCTRKFATSANVSVAATCGQSWNENCSRRHSARQPSCKKAPMP